ncbi:MAG: porin family protein [Alcanivoracaceae bacterium]|nr:porin family protein [Alcanivoracaceae bacterium]
MIVNRPFLRFLVSSLIAAAFSVQAALADPSALISAAKNELAAGNAEAAYAALQAEEAQYAGDIQFDYWLGLAANRAGKFGRAMFALERVLAQKPSHAAARLELATAYARLNLGEAARRELDILDGQNPPPAAREQIAQLRQQLGLADEARRLKKRIAFVTAEAGFDDNAGSYPKDFGFALVNVDEIAAPYAQIAAGVRQQIDRPANQRLTFSANTQAKRFDGHENINKDASQFDQNFIGGRAEWSRDLDGQREVAVGGDVGYLQLDGEHYYTYFGADAEWRHQRSAETRTLLTLGLRNMQFENDQYDNLMSRIRAGIRHRLTPSWQLSGDVAIEYEAAKNDVRPGGDTLRASLTGSAAWMYRPSERLVGDVSFSHSEYTKIYGAVAPLDKVRKDDRVLIGLNWDKTFQRVWNLRARVQYRNQDSNITTYTFDQTSGSVSLTRYF